MSPFIQNDRQRPLSNRLLALTFAAYLASQLPTTHASDQTTYIGPDSGLWSLPANWSNGIPNNNGTNTFEAVINTATGVTAFLDQNATVNTLTVGLLDTLSFQDGKTLTLASTPLVNSGHIQLNGTSSTLSLLTDATFSGQGEILLNSSSSRLAAVANGSRLTTDNFIHGIGTISLSRMTNNGTISAEGGTLNLAVGDFSLGPSVNNGTLRANGGTLYLGPILDNSNGIIEARANSIVNLYGTITGGSLRSIATGTLALGIPALGGPTSLVMEDVALSGSGLALVKAPAVLTVRGSLSNSGSLSVSGTILNFSSSGTNNTATFINSGIASVSGSLTSAVPLNISGSGTLFVGVLSVPNSSASTMSTNIRGSGTITGQMINSGTITGPSFPSGPLSISFFGGSNAGVIRAENGGSIILSMGSASNANGILDARLGGTITISDQVTGGTITGSNAGVIQASTLNSVTITGSPVVRGNVTITDGLIQDSPLFFMSQVSFQGASTITGTPRLGGAVFFSQQSLVDCALNIGGTYTFSGTTTSPTTIISNGTSTATISGSLNHNGTILSNAGTLNISSNSQINGGTITAANGGFIDGSIPPSTFSGTTLVTGISGRMKLSANVVNATINNQGTLTLTSFLRLSDSTLFNSGTVSFSGVSPSINISGNTTFSGPGVFQDMGDTTIASSGQLTNASTIKALGTWSGRINNSGLIVNRSGSQSLSINTLAAPDSFINAGIIRSVDVGILKLSGYFNNANGLIETGDKSELYVTNATISGGSMVIHGFGQNPFSPSIERLALNITNSNVTLENFTSSAFSTAPTSFFHAITMSISNSAIGVSGHLDLLNGSWLVHSSGSITVTGPITLSTIGANPSLTVTSRIEFNSTSSNSQNVASIAGDGKLSVGSNAVLTSDQINGIDLSIGSNAKHFIRPNVADQASSLIFLGLAGSTNNWTATFDIANNKLIVHPWPDGSPFPKSYFLPLLANQLLSGHHGGDWLGKGITSSTVAADNSATGSHSTTLALFDNADLGLTTFGGQPVDSNSLLIATALIADSNLSGTVDATDFDTWFKNVGSTTATFSRADFNNSGVVDATDFDLWFKNVGLSTTSLQPSAFTLQPSSSTPIPEPTTVAMLLLPLLVRNGRKPKRLS